MIISPSHHVDTVCISQVGTWHWSHYMHYYERIIFKKNLHLTCMTAEDNLRCISLLRYGNTRSLPYTFNGISNSLDCWYDIVCTCKLNKKAR